jgi:hypothetical protein
LNESFYPIPLQKSGCKWTQKNHAYLSFLIEKRLRSALSWPDFVWEENGPQRFGHPYPDSRAFSPFFSLREEEIKSEICELEPKLISKQKMKVVPLV